MSSGLAIARSLALFATVQLSGSIVAQAGTNPPASPQRSEAFADEELVSLDDVLGTPDWLWVTGEFLGRIQVIDDQFRANPSLERSQAFATSRLALRGDVDFEKLDSLPIGLTLEVADMRQFGAATGTPINASTVDATDILQGFGDFRLGELGAGTHRLRVGRQTLDLGSRRLIARHIYRTAINSFTGVDYLWQGENGDSYRLFWTMPVRRLPDDSDGVRANEFEFDREDEDQQLFGFLDTRRLTDRTVFENYTYVLAETDPDSLRRRFATPGLRLFTKRAPGKIDGELEAAGQFGTSRLTVGSAELNHLAFFTHAALGYTFDAVWEPNVQVALDYASGDRDPNDGENNRFDSLFGVQRPDFGPTEIYLALRRTNLISPELRVRVQPRDDFWAYVSLRPAWLEERTDRWPTANVSDPTGDSGDFLGTQFEVRARWTVTPKRLNFEVGGALLFPGEFPRNAPGGSDETTTFAYLQMRAQF